MPAFIGDKENNLLIENSYWQYFKFVPVRDAQIVIRITGSVLASLVEILLIKLMSAGVSNISNCEI